MSINKETALLLNHSMNPFSFWNTSTAAEWDTSQHQTHINQATIRIYLTPG